MVAVEGGRKSRVGVLYNEVPDRIADSLFIVALGYAIATPWLGWLGALAAAVTAYVRVLGGSLGLAQDFRGPMAKQHRMAVMTLACLVGIAESYFFDVSGSMAHGTPGLRVLHLGAWLIAIGGIITCGTRVHAIARQLKAR
jgi:phosphatidylglycerophosphate synthase